MTGIEWLAVLAGVAAIVWVNWYFFVAGQTGHPASQSRDQEEDE